MADKICEKEQHMDFTLPSSGMKNQNVPGKEIFKLGTRKSCGRLRKQAPYSPEQESPSDSDAEAPGDSFLEDYFIAHSKRSSRTSNHTLAKLAQPTMNVKAVKSLANVASFPEEKAALFGEYQSLYPYWLLQITHGFNILLYGVGSKKKLLEDFCVQVLAKSCHVVLYGYFPGLTIKQVLTQITAEILDHTGSFKSDLQHAVFIRKTLETRQQESSMCTCKEVFLVIHNIDGPSLRDEHSQSCLSILAQCSSIHILASVDHINAPLMWDQKKLSHFNWAWHDTTTYELYSEEVSYENSLLVQKSEIVGLSALVHVMESVTANARGIFNVLANHQLENFEGTYLGMPYQDCYTRCREKFFVSNDLTLRRLLIEFHDHKLVKSCNGPDGTEYLLISVEKGVLLQFMEQNSNEE